MNHDRNKLNRLRDDRDEARAAVRTAEERREEAQKANRSAADYLHSVRHSRVEPNASQLTTAEREAAETAEVLARRQAACDAANARYSQLARLVANLDAFVNAR